ncbi:MAG: hypothetical protein DRJ98_06150 [Thermoprotei archaeon]|nr:MAG: hypothetical protein DRJ98_06150 [Thermoprotei archaeon]
MSYPSLILALGARVRKLPSFQHPFLEDCLDLCDLASASTLLKISVEEASRLALRLKEVKAKVKLSDVACTKDARKVLKEVLTEAARYPVLEPARHSLLLTLPSLSLEEAQGRLRLVEEAMKLLREIDYEEVKAKLLQASFERAKLPILNVALALTSKKLYEEAEAMYTPFIKVELIDSAEKARNVVEENDVTLTMTQLPVDEPGLVPIAGLEDIEVVPHIIASLYSAWRKPLEAFLELAEIYGEFSVFKALREDSSLELIKEVARLMSLYSPEGEDIEEAFGWLEAEVKSLARRVLREGGGAESFKEGARSLIAEATDRFNLSWRAQKLLEEALEEVEAPYFELPRYKLEALRSLNRREVGEKRFLEARELVKKLYKVRESVKRCLKSLIDFDLSLALARFSLDYDLRPAKLVNKLGLGFINARNLTLLREEKLGIAKVQPVSYAIGDTEIKLLGATPQRVVLLTGANSGGKTTLLLTITQIHLMALLGLPVPAEKAEVPLMPLFLLRRRTAKRLGSLEYAIRRLRLIFTKPGPKLVLIDEFEALTEPGAMGRMMAALLNNLPRRSLTVFVTHLSREIIPHLRVPFRVDGIEAKGLDERGELIVDRQPLFNHVGASTPELIVSKLQHETASRRLRRLYESMLASLRQEPLKPLI